VDIHVSLDLLTCPPGYGDLVNLKGDCCEDNKESSIG
jgi:hypothetical protein